jgi:hypothetical protein
MIWFFAPLGSLWLCSKPARTIRHCAAYVAQRSRWPSPPQPLYGRSMSILAVLDDLADHDANVAAVCTCQLLRHDGFPSSTWPRLRLSFSAWLYSPSLGFPFGQNHEGWGAPRLAPLLLTFPPHRIARRVLRLDSRLRRAAVVATIRALRDDPLQPNQSRGSIGR